MKRVKIIAYVFAILLCIALFFAWYIKGGFVPWPAGEYEFKYVSSAQDDLIAAGFTNIELIPRDVASVDAGPWCEPVTEISIDGDTDFKAGKRYSVNVPVKIYYDRVLRKGVPISSEDIQNYEPEVLVKMFLDAGFTNVNLTEHHDLDRDFMHELDNWDLHEYYRTHGAALPSYFNEIAIDWQTHFDLGEPLPISAPVQIDAHYQPNMRVVIVNVTYQEPLNAITEPIRVYRNGELTPYWILEYGDETSLVLGLDDEDRDTLTLSFWREGSEWKSEELIYTVKEDTEVNITLGIDMRILLEETSSLDSDDRNMYLRMHMAHQ